MRVFMFNSSGIQGITKHFVLLSIVIFYLQVVQVICGNVANNVVSEVSNEEEGTVLQSFKFNSKETKTTPHWCFNVWNTYHVLFLLWSSVFFSKGYLFSE